MIYCVVPEVLADELYDRLESYYADDPHVTVIVDRRKRSRRGPGVGRDYGLPVHEMRELRDRRRARVPGELPDLTGD